MEEKFEQLGQLIDHLENLSYALKLPLPDSMHVESLRTSLPELVTEFKAAFVEVSGENPWE